MSKFSLQELRQDKPYKNLVEIHEVQLFAPAP
jgi:hypothetical protein